MVCQKAVTLIVDLCLHNSTLLDPETCQDFLFILTRQGFDHKDAGKKPTSCTVYWLRRRSFPRVLSETPCKRFLVWLFFFLSSHVQGHRWLCGQLQLNAQSNNYTINKFCDPPHPYWSRREYRCALKFILTPQFIRERKHVYD